MNKMEILLEGAGMAILGVDAIRELSYCWFLFLL